MAENAHTVVHRGIDAEAGEVAAQPRSTSAHAGGRGGEHPGDGEHAGPGEHAGRGDHAAQFRDRFWVVLVLTVPVVVWSHHVQMLLGYTAPVVPLQEWIGPVLGSVVFWWGGWPFLSGGWSELRTRRPGMMLLISLAITVAYVASVATALGVFSQELWWGWRC